MTTLKDLISFFRELKVNKTKHRSVWAIEVLHNDKINFGKCLQQKYLYINSIHSFRMTFTDHCFIPQTNLTLKDFAKLLIG